MSEQRKKLRLGELLVQQGLITQDQLHIGLTEQKTQVLALHVGFIDTDLTSGFDVPKSAPDAVVRTALDALEAGASEVLADDITRQVHKGLSAEPAVYLQAVSR